MKIRVQPKSGLRFSAKNDNSAGDEIANVNFFYAVHPEATRIRWNNAK